MRKWIGSIAAAAMGLGLSASAWACNTSNGEVLQVNTDARTVAMSKSGGSCCDEGTSASKANQMVFKLKKDTKILVNGKEATLADLKTGDKVKIDYERLDDVLKISVTRDS
jgi:Cu/Ag efflux protein CusF